MKQGLKDQQPAAPMRSIEDGGAKAIAEMICDFGRLKAAVRNLKNMKGRHNTEIAYKRLMEVFEEIDTPRSNAEVQAGSATTIYQGKSGRSASPATKG